MQAQERYTLVKKTPETSATKNERALVATGPPTPQDQDPNDNNGYSYCVRPCHNICQCRGLQKDLRDGRVKAGTVLPANFAFKGNSKRGNNHRDENYGNRKHKHDGSGGNNRNSDQGQNRSLDSDSDDDDDDGAKRKVFRQQRRDTGLIAVATTINPSVNMTAQTNVQLDPIWTIDSGCTRHVTHESQRFADIATSGGSITTDQCFEQAHMATNTGLYQFQDQSKTTATALMTKGAKPLMDSMMLPL
ncbi:Hypothetical protein PHPALM_291 [Phytophthora palmivora]|uniref:Uncharacterized protein n=1 Tax=Phytophthora palmivora TaxID=4796 RepID=A0A2P4YV91_9STRA|nr:Hypothetical protein PHPALM_291 [Phytophthora palmivora]